MIGAIPWATLAVMSLDSALKSMTAHSQHVKLRKYRQSAPKFRGKLLFRKRSLFTGLITVNLIYDITIYTFLFRDVQCGKLQCAGDNIAVKATGNGFRTGKLDFGIFVCK